MKPVSVRVPLVLGLIGALLMFGGLKAMEYVPETSLRAHPYLIEGRIAFYGGLSLLAAAIVIWIRHVPPAEPNQDWSTEE